MSTNGSDFTFFLLNFRYYLDVSIELLQISRQVQNRCIFEGLSAEKGIKIV